MKNAMKKLMAFALVAVMLVGMLPFAASADEKTATLNVKYGAPGEEDSSRSRSGIVCKISNGESTTVYNLLKYYYDSVSGDATYNYTGVGSASGLSLADLKDVNVAPGDTVTVRIIPTAIEDGKDDEIIDDGKDDESIDDGKDDESIDDGKDDEIIDDGKDDESIHEPIPSPIMTFQVRVGSNDKVVYDKAQPLANGASSTTIENLLNHWFDSDWDDDYTFSHYYSSALERTFKGSEHLYDTVFSPDTITVRLMPIETEDDNKDEEVVTEYVEVYVYVDGEKQSSNATKLYKNAELVDDILDDVKSSKWSFLGFKIDNESSMRTNVNVMVEPSQTLKMYFETKESKANSSKVYLHVFMNNDIEEPEKTINITNGIAADGKLDLYTDVKGVIKDYFSAKDSDGIKYDGMYYATGDWAGNYITDSEKYETITNVKQLKEDGYVHLNVMVTNAKLKSSSTADSTNPKTGDNIFMAVSVMTVTASALAVAFYLNKKRAV